MSFSKDQIMSKGQAIAEALSTMSVKERAQYPTPAFALDYNNFRDLALKLMPDSEPIFPPAIRTQALPAGVTQVFGRYVEILAYSKQIVAFVKQSGEAIA